MLYLLYPRHQHGDKLGSRKTQSNGSNGECKWTDNDVSLLPWKFPSTSMETSTYLNGSNSTSMETSTNK